MTIPLGPHIFCERAKLLSLARRAGMTIMQHDIYVKGYQVYLVEQWVCERSKPYSTVKVFTGDVNHEIRCCVIEISEEDLANPELDELFSEIDSDTKSRPKMTDMGVILVTDPASFSSDLDMVLISDGDYQAHIRQFWVNINLRRMHCAGRTSLNLNKPTDAQEDKFQSLFLVSDNVPFNDAVLEIVKLGQASLSLLGYLHPSYVDGLYCDETKLALERFFESLDMTERVELRESWLDPHVLAVLLNRIMDARNKLHSIGIQVPKDPFQDMAIFRKGISQIQKQHKIHPQTKCLDPMTWRLVNSITLREGAPTLKVHKVIKNKIEDFSGMTALPRDYAQDDLEAFVQIVPIDRLRTLWKTRGSKLSSQHEGDQDWLHGGKTLLRGVAGKTTKTGGAAVGIFRNVAESLSRRSTTDLKQRPDRKQTYHHAPTNQTPSPNMVVPSLVISPTVSYGSDVEQTVSVSPMMDSSDAPSAGVKHFPAQKPTLNDPEGRKPRRRPSPIDTSMLSPPIVASPKDSAPTTPMEMLPPIHLPDLTPEQTSRHTSVSPSLDQPPSIQPSLRRQSLDVTAPSTPIAENSVNLATPKKAPLERAYSTSDLAHMNMDMPVIEMDVQKYIVYERLRHQEAALKKTLERITALDQCYGDQAAAMVAMYNTRHDRFQELDKKARSVLEQQTKSHTTIKDLELRGAKLQYELAILSDKLKDIEQFVNDFATKVRYLQLKMPESKKSMHTMLIVGNYFSYYWLKMRNWMSWLTPKSAEQKLDQEPKNGHQE